MDALHQHQYQPRAYRSHPHTPPYTPATAKTKNKRRFTSASATPTTSRPHSPASWIYPAETAGPAKRRPAKRPNLLVDSELEVYELHACDLEYPSDDDEALVYPEEVQSSVASSAVNSSGEDGVGEAADVDGDDELSDLSMSGSEDEGEEGIERKFKRLHCADRAGEVEFEKGRRRRRESKRGGRRLFKRSHSESVRGGTAEPAEEVAMDDVVAVDDQDAAGSQRRLRRRTKGPEELVIGSKLSGEGGRGRADTLIETATSSPVSPTMFKGNSVKMGSADDSNENDDGDDEDDNEDMDVDET